MNNSQDIQLNKVQKISKNYTNLYFNQPILTFVLFIFEDRRCIKIIEVYVKI